MMRGLLARLSGTRRALHSTHPASFSTAAASSTGPWTPQQLADSKARLADLGGAGKIDLTFPSPHVALLTVSNPTKANAFSPMMMTQFHNLVSQLEGSEGAVRDLPEETASKLQSCRGLILTGDGSTFCSGADLSGGASAETFFTPECGAAMNMVMTDACNRLGMLPAISVSAINGPAVGGGAELCTATDFRMAAVSATVTFVQVKRGVVTGWGGLSRLIDICGRGTALYMTASAAKMPSDQAAMLKLLDAVCEPTEDISLLQHTLDWLQPMLHTDDAIVSSEVVRANKRTLAALTAAASGGWSVAGSDKLSQKKAAALLEAETFQSLWGGQAQLDALLQLGRNGPRRPAGAGAHGHQ